LRPARVRTLPTASLWSESSHSKHWGPYLAYCDSIQVLCRAGSETVPPCGLFPLNETEGPTRLCFAQCRAPFVEQLYSVANRRLKTLARSFSLEDEDHVVVLGDASHRCAICSAQQLSSLRSPYLVLFLQLYDFSPQCGCALPVWATLACSGCVQYGRVDSYCKHYRKYSCCIHERQSVVLLR
jgi:hypothetical protein